MRRPRHSRQRLLGLKDLHITKKAFKIMKKVEDASHGRRSADLRIHWDAQECIPPRTLLLRSRTG
jgi:hypothetical protein